MDKFDEIPLRCSVDVALTKTGWTDGRPGNKRPAGRMDDAAVTHTTVTSRPHVGHTSGKTLGRTGALPHAMQRVSDGARDGGEQLQRYVAS